MRILTNGQLSVLREYFMTAKYQKKEMLTLKPETANHLLDDIDTLSKLNEDLQNKLSFTTTTLANIAKCNYDGAAEQEAADALKTLSNLELILNKKQ